MRSTEAWRGELERARRSWVSVVTLLGMRLRIRIRSVRISCVIARLSLITNTRSLSRVFLAGSASGMRIGMVFSFLKRLEVGRK